MTAALCRELRLRTSVRRKAIRRIEWRVVAEPRHWRPSRYRTLPASSGTVNRCPRTRSSVQRARGSMRIASAGSGRFEAPGPNSVRLAGRRWRHATWRM